MSLVIIGPRPLARQVIIIGGKCIDSAAARSSRIIAGHVIPGSAKGVLNHSVESLGDAAAKRHFESIALQVTRRLNLPGNAERRVRSIEIVRGGRGIDIPRAIPADPSDAPIVHAERSTFRQLTIQARAELSRVGNLYGRIQSHNARGLGGIKYGRIGRVCQDRLAQAQAVITLEIEERPGPGAVIENPGTRSQYRFALFPFSEAAVEICSAVSFTVTS